MMLPLLSCSSLTPCHIYDSVEFCSYESANTGSIVKEIKNKFHLDERYQENKKYKSRWNSKINYVYKKLIQRKRDNYIKKGRKFLTIIRNRNKNSYKIYNVLSDSEKQMIQLGLEYYKKLNPNITKKEIQSFIIKAGYHKQIDFSNFVKNNIDYLSDYLYVRQAAEKLSDEIISVYHDNNRAVYVTENNLAPKTDVLGNLYLNTSIRENEIELIMLHEAVHIAVLGFNKLLNKYIIESFSSKEFIHKNILSILDPLSKKFIPNDDVYYGEASNSGSFKKEVFVDLLVLEIISNDYKKCSIYKNILSKNIVHGSEKLRSFFVEKSCEAMKKHVFNSAIILNVFKTILEGIKDYNYSNDINNKENISKKIDNKLLQVTNSSMKYLGYILVLALFNENMHLEKHKSMNIYGSNYFIEIYKRYREMNK